MTVIASTFPRRVRGRLARSVPETPVVLLVAVGVEIGLRCTSLPRLARVLGIRIGADTTPPVAGEAPTGGSEPVVLPRWSRRRVRASNRVLDHWPFGNTCLRQCLVLGQRLRQLEPVLRIGVRAEPDGKLLAHSWLEIGGLSIDPRSTTFRPFEGR